MILDPEPIRAGALPGEAEPLRELPDELWDGEWNDSASARSARGTEERAVAIPLAPSAPERGQLQGSLSVPRDAHALVVFVPGSGADRDSPADRFVAEGFHRAGFATLRFDLLMPDEAALDAATHALRFDLELLTARVVAALRWAASLPGFGGRVGCFATETGTAGALAAGALRPELVWAVVSRAGRSELVDPPVLQDVGAPVLLIVSGRDAQAVTCHRVALAHLPGAELAVVADAENLLEGRGALRHVVALATEWFRRHEPGVVSTSKQAAP